MTAETIKKLYCPQCKGDNIEYEDEIYLTFTRSPLRIYCCHKCEREYFEMDCLTEEQLKKSDSIDHIVDTNKMVENEYEWISFSDRKPKVGQKIEVKYPYGSGALFRWTKNKDKFLGPGRYRGQKWKPASNNNSDSLNLTINNDSLTKESLKVDKECIFSMGPDGKSDPLSPSDTYCETHKCWAKDRCSLLRIEHKECEHNLMPIADCPEHLKKEGVTVLLYNDGGEFFDDDHYIGMWSSQHNGWRIEKYNFNLTPTHFLELPSKRNRNYKKGWEQNEI